MPAATAHSTDYNAVLKVGLEIHVELATRSKMFSSAPNVAHPDYFDAEPNTLCDPVVLGMPGVLPVINKQAVEMSILVGLALNCQIAKRTKWDRKSYYYPDLPKNYQISQYDQPLCYEGHLDIPLAAPASHSDAAPTKTIRIIRAHLEEDAGKLLHEAPGGDVWPQEERVRWWRHTDSEFGLHVQVQRAGEGGGEIVAKDSKTKRVVAKVVPSKGVKE